MEALYDGELSYLDAKLEELFEWLESRGLYDDTLIIVAGEHGQEFCGHHFLGNQIVNHHFALYDSIVRVPMIVRYPDEFEDEKVKIPVQLTDVPLTITDVIEDPAVDIAGGASARSLCDPDSQRVALAEYLTPPSKLDSLREHAPEFDWSTYEVDLRMARSRTQKVVRYRNRDTEQLYNLTDDPTEQDDISGRTTADQRLIDTLEEWDEPPESSTADVSQLEKQDGDVQEHLKDLGYI